MLTLQNFKNTNIFIFLWRAMLVFQHFRINLPKKYKIQDGFFDKKDDELQSFRSNLIKTAYNKQVDFIFYNKKYVFFPNTNNNSSDILTGYIARETEINLREKPDGKIEKKKHHHRSLVVINYSSSEPNGQQIFIQKTTGFNRDLSKLMQAMWEQQDIDTEELDIKINPLITETGFWEAFNSKKGINEIIIEYNRGNFANGKFKQEVTALLDCFNAENSKQIFTNKEGKISANNQDYIQSIHDEVKTGHGSIVMKRKVEIKSKKKETVYNSNDEKLIKETEIEFNGDGEFSDGEITEIIKQLNK